MIFFTKILIKKTGSFYIGKLAIDTKFIFIIGSKPKIKLKKLINKRTKKLL